MNSYKNIDNCSLYLEEKYGNIFVTLVMFYEICIPVKIKLQECERWGQFWSGYHMWGAKE